MPKGHSFAESKTRHPYIRAQDIRNGSIGADDSIYIGEETHEKIKRYTVDKGDVCIVIVGANVGDVGIVPPCLSGANLTENAVKLQHQGNKLTSQYLNYALLSDDAQGQMKLLAAGAAQPKLGLYKVKEVVISLPPIGLQHRIASILSAYDDLIENNTRRIAILEEMARRIYQEWFVHFRFPGHEKVRMVDSELGRIPEGWGVKLLLELASITMGQSPKSEFYNETGEGLPFHQGVRDFGPFFPSDRVYCTVQNRIAEEGDILFSVRAPVGRINVATKKIVVGRGLSAISSNDDQQIFLLSQLREKFSEEDLIGGGTIFKAVSKKDMQSIQLIQPPPSQVSAFQDIVTPMWRMIRVLSDKNANLRQTRDLLLPKLISGEIDVSEMSLPKEAAA